MPYVKRKRRSWYRSNKRLKRGRRPSRRVARGRRRAFRRTYRIYRPIGGFPSRKRVTLMYSNRWLLDPNTTQLINYAVTDRSIVCNGLFDPCYKEAGGDKPQNFDQWMNIYQWATVTSSVAVFKFTSVSESNRAVTVGVYRNQYETSNPSIPSNIREIDHLIMDKRNTGNVTVPPGGTATVRCNFSAYKEFGTRAIVGKENYRCSKTSNPPEVSQWLPWVCAFKNAAPSDGDEVYVHCRVYYNVVLSEALSVGPSVTPEE